MPAHTHDAVANTQEHLGDELVAIGRKAATKSLQAKATLLPVETVWAVHDMPLGHRPGKTRLGPTFADESFAGTPAILIRAKILAANFTLRSALPTGQSPFAQHRAGTIAPSTRRCAPDHLSVEPGHIGFGYHRCDDRVGSADPAFRSALCPDAGLGRAALITAHTTILIESRLG